MSTSYFHLKQKLEELGYNNTLTVESVPLVECILADLLQTTRSLQHYMDLSKDTLMQRDSLMLETEPYKNDNIKLIKENNQLHREIVLLQEENLKLTRESKRKAKKFTDELAKKESLISKLQYDVRDLSLRGICAGTQSSRSKSRRKDAGDDNPPKVCLCHDLNVNSSDQNLNEQIKKLQCLEEKNEALNDEIFVLRTQVEHRDHEIIRLNILLEEGRPMATISKDLGSIADGKSQNSMKQIIELKNSNELVKKELETCLEKQHEAMLRAINLADKNKILEDELAKVDMMALKVEEDCNKRLSDMVNEIKFMQSKIDGLLQKNVELDKLNCKLKANSPEIKSMEEKLKIVLNEKLSLQKEIRDLAELNKGLQDKILSFYSVNRNYESDFSKQCSHDECLNKGALQTMLEIERKKYENYMSEIQNKFSETMILFNSHLLKCKENASSPKPNSFVHDTTFVKELHNKLCEKEQNILMLKKERDELKSQLIKQDEYSKLNYREVISQLNTENSELSRENMSLTQKLSQHRCLNSAKHTDRCDLHSRDIQKLKEEIESLKCESQILRKDKNEYNIRYKEAMELVDKLKRDLNYKQRQMEQLEEENNSYKMTNRTGKASADHLKEECIFLREQIKRMQSDVIKEKTVANQIKNIQLETERSSNEVQNELLCVQKKLSLTKTTIECLEKKCKDLQSEITSLQKDKSNLIESVKKLDKEHDEIVIELDNKTENVNLLEQKIKSQNYEICKLQTEISELKRNISFSKVSEHKIADYEAKMSFLNGEILRLTQQYDNAVMENKHLQNNLADGSGTLKIHKIELEKSRKEVEGLKHQLQHYVAEIRRIEELLSHKEAERSDMLEQFASLSVEANILENTNHSLESESASKSVQLQSYISKIQSLESQLIDKENLIDSQSARIATMACKITALENEVKLITEEKAILEQNISYLKRMCNNLQSENCNVNQGIEDTNSEIKLYDTKIKSLSHTKTRIEHERNELQENLETTEKLLSNARKEIIELKLALQDATSETKSLHERIQRFSRRETEIHETTLTKEELELPLMLEETIHEVSHEEDDDSYRRHEIRKRFSKYAHGSTL